MHRVTTSIREIAPADLPKARDLEGVERTATDSELLNMGLQRINGDLFSCIEQSVRDDETLLWKPAEGQPLPGTIITEGNLKDRHDKLPSEIRGKILKASVIRSSLGNADDLASAVLIEAAEAAEAAVGRVEGRPLIDVADAGMVLSEAKRQLEVEGSGFSREAVPMDDVAVGDVIEAEGIIPHQWAGEPRR